MSAQRGDAIRASCPTSVCEETDSPRPEEICVSSSLCSSQIIDATSGGESTVADVRGNEHGSTRVAIPRAGESCELNPCSDIAATIDNFLLDSPSLSFGDASCETASTSRTEPGTLSKNIVEHTRACIDGLKKLIVSNSGEVCTNSVDSGSPSIGNYACVRRTSCTAPHGQRQPDTMESGTVHSEESHFTPSAAGAALHHEWSGRKELPNASLRCMQVNSVDDLSRLLADPVAPLDIDLHGLCIESKARSEQWLQTDSAANHVDIIRPGTVIRNGTIHLRKCALLELD